MNRLQRKFGLIIFLFCAALLGACGPAAQKGDKPSADWSRSVSLGDNLIGSIGFLVDGSGERVHLVWPLNEGQGPLLRYRQLDQRANPILTLDMDFPGQLRSPRLLNAGPDRLHLFWANRATGSPGWTLWHAFLDNGGNLIGEPRQVSPDGADIGSYVIATDNQGGAMIAWSTRDIGGLSLLHLSKDGQVIGSPVEINPRGISPDLRVAADGVVHLVWQEGTNFRYATLSLTDMRPQDGVPVVNLVIGTGDSLAGPVLGVTDDRVYVIWSKLSQSGLQSGTARTEFVSFPIGEPKMGSATPIWILPDEEQPYQPYQGSLTLSQLVEPPQEAWQTTDFILHPATITNIGSELVVALAANQQFRADTILQIAVVVMNDGRYQGYSFASKTDHLSDSPVVSLDPSGDIYLAWREGAGGQKVFYATTQPAAMATLDRVGAGDFANAILEGGMESLVSIAFMPFVGFGWILPGLVVIGIWKLYKHQENVSQPSSWPVLIIGYLLYLTIKFITLPTIVTYVPFSAWISIPSGAGRFLQIAVPLLIFVISVWVANFVRKRYSESTLAFYLALTATDAVLTLAVYGVNFLGVY